ncbi:hypothetical protein A0H81_14632 [Grifola frondosa]|uniref:Uncharacterized protein n=1 Tax=Grifola frondosa TaxID=5627 RepID=A0A1C7LNB0_GRIFR|nr:hypothetical protein A0H81_14632 [Grifola frondosa]
MFIAYTRALSQFFLPQFVKRTIPINPHSVGLARSSFSTSIARGAQSDDNDPNGFEIPEMTPDSLLELFEDRMATCSDPQWLTAADPDPRTSTRERYLKTIMSNIWLLSAYLMSVDVDEFRMAEVEPGSRIDRGRNALMTLAKVTAMWMHEAFPTGTDDEELTECLWNLAHNVWIITEYEKRALPADISWTDISDVLVISLRLTHGAVKEFIERNPE